MASCSPAPMPQKRIVWDLMKDSKILWGESKRRKGSVAAANFARYSQSSTIQEAISLGARLGDLDYEHRKGSLSFEEGTNIHYSSPSPPSANAVVECVAEAEDGQPAQEVLTTLLDLKEAAGIAFIQVNPKRKKTEAHDRFARYSKATTYREALELGASERDLTFDCKRGYVMPLRKSVQLPLADEPVDQSHPDGDSDAGGKRFVEVGVQVDLPDFKKYLREQLVPKHPDSHMQPGFRTPPRRTQRGLPRSPF